MEIKIRNMLDTRMKIFINVGTQKEWIMKAESEIRSGIDSQKNNAALFDFVTSSILITFFFTLIP